MFATRRIDPLGRQAALAIAAGRVGIGVGALLATGPALRALGFPPADGAARSLARLAGGRDIALGLLAIAARDDRRALRTATLVAAAVDAADAVSLGLAGADPATRKAGLLGSASGGSAALAGLWAWRRLGA
jgi:hypothetical protein